MRLINIDASPKQLSRLRNGHRVRIKQGMEGSGFNLVVDPSKFDSINRSFSKGSAYQIQLSPDELMANKDAVDTGKIEGQGIYTGGKIKIKVPKIKVPSKSQVESGLKQASKAVQKGATKTGDIIVAGEKAVRKNPVSRTVIKTGVPILASRAIEVAAVAAGADPRTAKELGKVGGEATKAGLTEAGYGLYAGSSGRGLGCGFTRTCGSGLNGPPSRMIEKSSIFGGSLLGGMNPALQSDAAGANLHMNTQLMPQFQRGGMRFV